MYGCMGSITTTPTIWPHQCSNGHLGRGSRPHHIIGCDGHNIFRRCIQLKKGERPLRVRYLGSDRSTLWTTSGQRVGHQWTIGKRWWLPGDGYGGEAGALKTGDDGRAGWNC